MKLMKRKESASPLSQIAFFLMNDKFKIGNLLKGKNKKQKNSLLKLSIVFYMTRKLQGGNNY